MGNNVSGIQPSLLTDEELVKYAWLLDKRNMTAADREWFEELRKRLERLLDENNNLR